jgi:hypothetical protein
MKYTFTLVICLSYFATFGQETFSERALIQANGDTLKGYISNLYDSKTIEFRKTKNSKKQTFSPTQIQGFILDGNTFLSKYVNITSYEFNRSLKKYSFVNEGLFLEKRTEVLPYKDSIFAQQIVKGKVNLYQLTNTDGSKGIYAERNTKILELPPVYFEFKKDTARGYGYFIQNGKYNQIPNFSGTYTQQNVYLDSLNYLMREEDNYYEMPKDINIEYNLETLASFVKNYNSTIQNESGNEVKNNKIKKRVYFGFTYGKIKPLFEPIFSTPSSTLSSPKSSALSIFALLPNYGANRNLFFRFGYQRYNYDIIVTDRGQTRSKIIRQVDAVSVGLRYALINGYVRPYIGASLTAMKQSFYGNKITEVEFPLLPEVGVLVPIGKVNFIIQGNMYPFFKDTRYYFKISTVSVGLML